MKHMKLAGLVVVAAFALSAIAAATASAAELPELYQCAKTVKAEKKYTGHYSSKKCTKESYVEAGGQEYELEPGIGKGKEFKGKGGDANLEIEGIGGVRCSKSADTGFFNTPKTADKVHVTFTGCTFETHPCTNTGKAGEVKTNALKGEVGYLEGKGTEHPLVGDLLTAESGTYEAEFSCLPLYFRVSGKVIGEVDPTDVNKFTKEATLTFKESSGIQHWKCFEGETPCDNTLISELSEVSGEFHSGQIVSAESTEVTNKGEELELKA